MLKMVSTDDVRIDNDNNNNLNDELSEVSTVINPIMSLNNNNINNNVNVNVNDTKMTDDKILMAYATLRKKHKKERDSVEMQQEQYQQPSTSSSLTYDSANNLIGKFCTIRPSTIHKLSEQNNEFVKLNKRLKSTTASSDNLEALNVLTQLDRILETHTHDESQELNKNIKIEPDKINECLSDLDAYLDGIDNSNNNNNFYSNDSSIVNLTSSANDDRTELISNELKPIECIKSSSTTTSLSSYLNSKRKINNKNIHFATLPKHNKLNNNNNNNNDRNDIQETDLIDFIPVNNNLCNEETNIEFNLQRNHPLRKTIGGISTSTSTSSVISAIPMENQINHHRRGGRTRTELEPQRRLSWLRNSMRKIRPILLPTQTNIIENDNNLSTSTSDCNALVQSESLPPSYQESNFMQLSTTTTPQTTTTATENQTQNFLPIDVQQITPTRINSTGLDNNTFPLDIFDAETIITEERPRQLGRRAEIRPRLISIAAEIPYVQRVMSHDRRPNSAPARVIPCINSTRTNFMGSEPSSVGSSRNPSPVSIVSSTGSSNVSDVENNERPRPRQSSSESDDATQMNSNNSNSSEDETTNEFTKWPNQFGRVLATVSCTLGLFNISRFSVFSVHFGANFIVQFLILSFIFGIPMLWLQMCLSAKLRCGPISMWKISPICKGISFALLTAQGIIGLYSTISLGWILVYFRDSLISRTTRYRWEEIFELYRGSGNITVQLSERVSDYFNGVVLQRHQLGPGRHITNSGIGSVRFQLAFNISILWTTVFVILCKGLRSYGKVVLILGTLPLIGLTTICLKFLTIIDFSSLQNLFPATDWAEFFPNSQSWMTAAQETFLTWNLFGASVLSIYSKANKKIQCKTALRRDAFFIVLITIYGLIIAAVLGNACVQIITEKGYLYYSGSYETLSSNVFLYPTTTSIPHNILSIPSKYLPRYPSLVGDTFYRPAISLTKESGYQVLRLVTEILPATFSLVNISSVWCLFTNLTLLLFGIGQLCAIWKPIANSLGNTPSSVLLSCVVGLLLGIPLATESGITIIHFLDVIFGGAWWLLILWVGQIIGVFLIRGRPYTSDTLVNDLRLSQTFSAFLAFSWNVLIPIVMMLLCVLDYKSSNSKDLFHRKGQSYWPLWARQLGGFIQISFLIMVPITAVIQIYRYLSKGPPDILDRIQMLYRPNMDMISQLGRPIRRPDISTMAATTITIPLESTRTTPSQDEPPKYTPPPSYTTATGARLAKMLRQSIRRSVRRIMGETSRRNRPALQQTSTASSLQQANELTLPPDYSTVFSDPSGELEIGPRILFNSHTQRDTLTTQRPQTIERARRLTAVDVAQLLRPSRTNKSHRTSSLGHPSQIKINNLNKKTGISRSVENLVLNAAQFGQSNNMITLLNNNNQNNNNHNRTNNDDNNVSVI